MSISKEAVIWGYRLFLGRDPESEQIISEYQNIKDEESLSRLLISSQEFYLKNSFGDLIDIKAKSSSKFIVPHLSTSSINLVIIGNCQIHGLACLIQAMTGDVVATALKYSSRIVEKLNSGDFDNLLLTSDLILMHPAPHIYQIITQRVPAAANKIKMIPRIIFSAFHPDTVYVERKGGGLINGALGQFQSSIAFYGWKNNFNIEQTISLFVERVYEHLGFFNFWNSSRKSLILEGADTGLRLEHFVDLWSKCGAWMHVIYHPKWFVLADVAHAILAREGISIIPGLDKYVHDQHSDDSVWPVYPEIAKRFGIEGHYKFKMPLSQFKSVIALDLENFVKVSFESFSKFNKDELVCERLDSSRYYQLEDFLKTRHQHKSVCTATASDSVNSHKTLSPYSGLADYQFWRHAITQLPMDEVDPVVRSGFTLSLSDKVATAGSCFAQHISRTIQQNGFNYFVSETGDTGCNAEERQKRNYGVFSARFGNIYTARQLTQLFERAYGTFIPSDQYWVRGDGKFVDPFRPQVEPDGFTSVERLENDRVEHFAAVREMFEHLDFFVFTLGLTESWHSRVDGAVFPLAPGVVAGEMDFNRYEFVNFAVSDVVTDMQAFIVRLLEVNPKARIVLTVSPVPLIATYENRHVLVSTTSSKSILRAAAAEICQCNAVCEYFPSYEIITGNYTKGAYFENDLRSIKQEGVDHVMRLFLRHYAAGVGTNNVKDKLHLDIEELDADFMRENATSYEIICDEEALDPF